MAQAASEVSEPRKHHYVPVFYQNNFVNASGLLWVYDRDRRSYKELHPKVICVEKDLYTLKPKDAPWNRRVESLALAVVDGMCASTVRQLEAGKLPANSSIFPNIAYFAGIQYARLPSKRDFISSVYEKGAKEIMRLSTVSVDRMKTVIDNYSRDTGTAINVSPESLIEAVRGNHLEIKATEVPFIKQIFKRAEFLSKLFFEELSWEILFTSPERGFILCDDPVVTVPPRGTAAVGFLVPGSVSYFPLTRSLCLRLGTNGQSFGYRNMDREAVRLVNQNVAANSTRFIMGPVKEQLEAVVSRSASVGMDPEPRFTVEITEDDDNGSIQSISTHPRRYFYEGNATQAP
jgi:hypothetical protein